MCFRVTFPVFRPYVKMCTMIEVSSEQSRSKFYMNTRAAAATAAALSRLLLLLFLFLLPGHRVDFHNRVPGPDG